VVTYRPLENERLRFAPEVLTRLGEELIPRPEQGIMELVRNAYDADAKTCTVVLHDVGLRGGAISIEDDGIGMTLEDIRTGWLILGRSQKTNIARTRRGRLTVGDKGLGRLAALRLGEMASLVTRPKEEPGIAYHIDIDWKRFAHATVVEEVPLSIARSDTDEPAGTTIRLASLRQPLTERDIGRLARSLVLLADPFESKSDFRPQLVAPGFQTLEKLVHRAYFDDASFYLRAAVDDSGEAHAELQDWRGKTLARAKQSDLAPKNLFKPPAATFELWNFLLQADRMHVLRRGRVTALKEWLSSVGGVYLYHRGLRVYPYGDPGHDWLDLNLQRVRSPEERPSTNNSVGRVVVDDPSHILIQKTDRTGFIESESFEALRAFCRAALDWMADVRLRQRDERAKAEKRRAPQAVRRARASLEHTVEALPKAVRPAVTQAIRRLEAARQREIRVLRDDLGLYRTLGTVGTTVAVFAHESGKPVTQISQMSGTIERRARQRLSAESYAEYFEQPLRLIQNAVSALKTYAQIPLTLLRRERRRHARVDVNAAIRDAIAMFSPFLAEAQIDLTLDCAEPPPVIHATIASIDAIVSNLITNAITALVGADGPRGRRQILVRTEVHKDAVLISVLDNGPGIRGLAIEDIWLPGRTTKINGTGLGLTIVRDVVDDMQGHAMATARGAYGGAEFLVTLPLASGTGQR
jgi:signal transduction histidine kinase